jgi:hypothetical protein
METFGLPHWKASATLPKTRVCFNLASGKKASAIGVWATSTLVK